MRFFLLGAIWLYWKTVPLNKRRNCIFRESCSVYVFRITKTKGSLAGLKALFERFADCRPGYTLVKSGKNNEFELHLKNGKIIEQDNISVHIFPFNSCADH